MPSSIESDVGGVSGVPAVTAALSPSFSEKLLLAPAGSAGSGIGHWTLSSKVVESLLMRVNSAGSIVSGGGTSWLRDANGGGRPVSLEES